MAFSGAFAMKDILSVAVLAAIVSAGAVDTAAAGVNLVSNPDFQNPVYPVYNSGSIATDWAWGGGDATNLHGASSFADLPSVVLNPFFGWAPVFATNPAGAPYAYHFSDAGTNYEEGPAYTAITLGTLTPGKSYTLSFYEALAGITSGATGSAHWVADLGGAPDGSGAAPFITGGDSQTFADMAITTPGTTVGWQEVSTTFTYKAGYTDYLLFTAIGSGAPPVALLTDVSLTSDVPESSTWAMMIAGIAGLGWIARRRRSADLAIRAS
jgi:hypothetical protein